MLMMMLNDMPCDGFVQQKKNKNLHKIYFSYEMKIEFALLMKRK